MRMRGWMEWHKKKFLVKCGAHLPVSPFLFQKQYWIVLWRPSFASYALRPWCRTPVLPACVTGKELPLHRAFLSVSDTLFSHSDLISRLEGKQALPLSAPVWRYWPFVSTVRCNPLWPFVWLARALLWNIKRSHGIDSVLRRHTMPYIVRLSVPTLPTSYLYCVPFVIVGLLKRKVNPIFKDK